MRHSTEAQRTKAVELAARAGAQAATEASGYSDSSVRQWCADAGVRPFPAPAGQRGIPAEKTYQISAAWKSGELTISPSGPAATDWQPGDAIIRGGSIIHLRRLHGEEMFPRRLARRGSSADPRAVRAALADLSRRLERLEAWRENAVQLYPLLGEPPVEPKAFGGLVE